jgi:hypothetical protein
LGLDRQQTWPIGIFKRSPVPWENVMTLRRRLLVLLATLALVCPALAAEKKKSANELISFGTLRAVPADTAQAQAIDWLKSVGRGDVTTLQQAQAIWAETDTPVLDRVAATFALGDSDAARLLASARDPQSPPPLTAPTLLKDGQRSAFFRANLALAYAKHLCERRVYEEALDSLRAIRPEQVVEPATYFFYKAVAEHALMHKEEASRSLVRLLDDVADAPERYKHVALLMHFDMLSWKEKDLGWIGRKMDNIERRLDLARGGPQTQKMQKDVISRLDELIKQLENQAKGSSQCNAGGCPSGAPKNGNQPGGTNQPSTPQQDSIGGNNSGPGNVDQRRLEGLAKQWGKLPEKERVAAMEALKRDLPPRYREAIESYFKKMAQAPSK